MVLSQGPVGGHAGVSPYQLFPAVACFLSTIDDSHITKSYKGYEVLRVNISTQAAYETIKNVYLGENFDFWSPPSLTEPTDIMVSPEQSQALKYLLNSLNVDYSMMNDNLEEAIQIERHNSVSLRRDANSMNWQSYQTDDTILAWMEKMAEQNPALVSVITYGKSTEGRDMKVMKISTAGPSSNRSAVWVDAGIHAREWITPAVATYIANELITQATRKRTHRLVDTLDWYIAPLLNPDGYAYTMTSERLWRKTRSNPQKGIFDSLFGCCKGADPNRNWDSNWGGKGTSKNQCSQIYHGPAPASEPEVSSTQAFIYENKDNIKLFVTMHSYSQLILLPWCYDNVRTDDYEDLIKVANKAADALKVPYGTQYKVGPTAELLYPAAGGSFDWAKGVAGIKYAYAFELRDKGTFGFLLPPNQIVPTGQETFNAIKSMAQDVMVAYRLVNTRLQPDNSTDQLFQNTEY